MKPTSAVWEAVFSSHYLLRHCLCSATWARCRGACFGRQRHAVLPDTGKGSVAAPQSADSAAFAALAAGVFYLSNPGHRRDIGCLPQPAQLEGSSRGSSRALCPSALSPPSMDFNHRSSFLYQVSAPSEWTDAAKSLMEVKHPLLQKKSC